MNSSLSGNPEQRVENYVMTSEDQHRLKKEGQFHHKKGGGAYSPVKVLNIN